MKKQRLLKGLSVSLALALFLGCVPLFVGCNPDKMVAKAAKKLNKYEISATLEEDGTTVNATEKFTYQNKTDRTQTELWFHLYGRAFREGARVLPYTQTSKAKCFPNGESYGNLQISQVLVNGTQTEFSYGGQDENVLIVPVNIEKNQKAEIEVAFVLTLAECTHRLGHFEDKVNLGNWYPVLCVFENGEFVADPYYSTGDPFYSECANYVVEFSYPSSFVLGNTGKVTKTTQTSGKTTAKMEARAVRDFALILGKNYLSKSVKVGDTTLTYLGYEGDSDIDQNLETARRALKTFNELFGTYPYRTLTVAKTPFLFGGMEYPNLVWVADNVTDKVEMTKVIAHEIAHQWWYGLVGNNEVKHAYIDEALAEYSVVLFFQENDSYGYSGEQMVQDAALSYQLYNEVVASIKGTLNDTLNQPTTEFATEYEYVYVVYVRGTLFMDALRDKVGDKEFLSTLKSYAKKHRFGIATRDDFLNAFSKGNGDDISDLFAEWKA